MIVVSPFKLSVVIEIFDNVMNSWYCKELEMSVIGCFGIILILSPKPPALGHQPYALRRTGQARSRIWDMFSVPKSTSTTVDN